MADLVGAGERYAVDPLVGYERVAERAARARENIEHAARQPGLVEQRGQLERNERRGRGWLEDHAVAHHQRWRDLPDWDGEREVPGRDHRDDAERHAHAVEQRVRLLHGDLLAPLH